MNKKKISAADGIVKENRTAEEYAFSKEEKAGVYRAIFERRDIRSYRPEFIDNTILQKILNAAHNAPSVGFMQPWNFMFIDKEESRRFLYEHFLSVNKNAAEHYDDERKLKYQSLKLQGLLDAPHLILVTCDTARGGEHVLGRATIKETDIYSTCLAIENLWLVARAEGIGVGWMSLYDPQTVNSYLSIPDTVIPVALLTLGFPVEFPDRPLLETTGWNSRAKLSDVIFYEQWNNKNINLDDSRIRNQAETQKNSTHESMPFDTKKAAHRNNDLTKPRGSLGQLETIMLRIGKIQNRMYPISKNKRLFLFAGDHGISEENISAYNQSLTAKMMYQIAAGTAAVNVFARQNGVSILSVDAGVNHDFENASGIVHEKIRRSTRNFSKEKAMTESELSRALLCGRKMLEIYGDCNLAAVGELGIGNTASASAVTSALLGITAEKTVGRGTGVGDESLNAKMRLIDESLMLHKEFLNSPESILQCLGGYEIAAITGLILEASTKKVPVVLDGFITTAAALAACRMDPQAKEILFAGHLSREKAHSLILEELGLRPILDLDLALGEGTGAVLAMGIIDSSVRIMSEMKTFEESGIENPINPAGLR